jgi:uncharacterized protein (DUF1015 family)
VPRFEPFPGLTYDPDRVRLADVVAPPYDVISPSEQAALQTRSPYNSVRIDLPDSSEGVDPYQSAARRIGDWMADGILRHDDARLYGYRMTYTDDAGQPGRTIGVIGALGLEPPGTDGIFPHERTTPKARSDRLQLLETTKVNTSPIWGLSLAKGLTDEIDAPEGLEEVVDEEDVSHSLWPITDPATVARITAAVSGAPVILADGHHRFETALNYQALQGSPAEGSAGPRDSDSVMALIVELAEDQLSVQGIHRLISGLHDDFDVPGALAAFFDLTATDAPDATIAGRMVRAGGPALTTPEGTWLLEAKPATREDADQDLDSSRLELALAALPEHDVIYQHGWDLALGAVARGEAQAAVLLRPVTLDQIASTGRGGERMPPKSTFFWPKPRTGFVFRKVAD